MFEISGSIRQWILYPGHASADVVEGVLHPVAGSVLQVRVNMGEKSEETRNFMRGKLTDGEHVFLRSIWQTANFSVVVCDGCQAWFRSVSTKEVESIARQWNIDVDDFMRSARARLSCQHPTTRYSVCAEKGSEVLNLSFNIDDLWEGELEGELDFKLRMERTSDVKSIVCEMLGYLFDSHDKLSEQLMETETRLEKELTRLAASTEQEPSITLSLTRSSGHNRRRLTSAFPEPRVRDFSKLKPVEDRDPPAHAPQLRHDPSPRTSALQPPSFNLRDDGVTSADREASYFERHVVNRRNDLTVKMVALTPKIMRALTSFSNSMDRNHGMEGPNLHDCGDEKAEEGAVDERSLKITEMGSPRREEQLQRSSYVQRANCASPGASAQAVWQTVPAPENSPAEGARDSSRSLKECSIEDRAYRARNTTFSGLKNTPEKRSDVGVVIPEKSSSNVVEVKSKRGGEVEAKEAKANEDWTGKATLADGHLSPSASDSSLRVKAGLPKHLLPLGHRVNEAIQANTETVTADTEPESRASERQESPGKTPRKKSSVTRDCLWDDARVTAPLLRKRTTVIESYTDDDDDDDDDDDYDAEFHSDYEEDDDEETEEEDEETRVRGRQKSTRSGSSAMARPGRPRNVSDREASRSFGFANQCDDGVSIHECLARMWRSGTYKPMDGPIANMRRPGKYKPRPETFQKRTVNDDSTSRTIADLICFSDGNKDQAAARVGIRHVEKKRRRDDGDDGSLHYEEENVVKTNVPDPDFYDFDKDRTEALVMPDQVWALYAEVDEMPRAYARIDKVFTVPKFKAWISWLQPLQPSEEATRLSKLSGYSTSCGEFEVGVRGTLTEINCFSHPMVVAPVSPTRVMIFPQKGEIWAIYKQTGKQSSSTSSHSGKPKSRFRLVEITDDVLPGTRPRIFVLGRVPGFHTIWKPDYKHGALPNPDLSLFSHRVPAYSMQGRVLRGKNLQGAWDIDPAGLPPCESLGDI